MEGGAAGQIGREGELELSVEERGGEDQRGGGGQGRVQAGSVSREDGGGRGVGGGGGVFGAVRESVSMLLPNSKNVGGGTSSTAAEVSLSSLSSLWASPLPSVLPSLLPSVLPSGLLPAPVYKGDNTSRPVSCRDLPHPASQPTQGWRAVMEALAAKCRFFEESFLAEQMRSGALEGQLQLARAKFKSAEESCQDLEQELELERAAAFAREREIEPARLRLCEHERRLGLKEKAADRAVEEANVLKDAVQELEKSKAALEVELASAARTLVAKEQAHRASQERERATLMQVARVLYSYSSTFALYLTPHLHRHGLVLRCASCRSGWRGYGTGITRKGLARLKVEVVA
jgi:hypothetical protein